MRGVARTKLAVLMLSGLALSAPFALVAKVQAALVESAASAAVRTLSSVSAPLSPATVAAAPVAAVGVPLAIDAGGEQGGSRAPGTPQAAGARAKAVAKPQALFVSASTVLQLSQSAARPQGSFVPQTSQHPAGLRLVGVGALGIGVQDGDILIDAMGISPRASGEIIGAIIEARARRVYALSGTLWRSGHTFRITVEQPYLGPA